MTLDLLLQRLDTHSIDLPCCFLSHEKPQLSQKKKKNASINIVFVYVSLHRDSSCVSHAMEMQDLHLASPHGKTARHTEAPALT